MGYKGRDVEVVEFDQHCLVVACDSCGAVGQKELDVIQASNTLVGRLTTRVALLEVLAVGALPQIVTAAITCEPDPTGNAIVEGIRRELTEAGFDGVPLSVSTEKNFATRQTGLGVSVSGFCASHALKIDKSCSGDRVWCIGVPLLGEELTNDPRGMVTIEAVRGMLREPDFHEIVPVGSRGIRKEAEDMASRMGCRIRFTSPSDLDLDKSAGPSTCLITTMPPAALPGNFKEIPVHEIGVLEPLSS